MRAPFMTVSFLSLLLGGSAVAQEASAPPVEETAPVAAATPVPAEPPQTLFGNRSSGSGTSVTGWFIAPTFGTTGFAGRLAYDTGIRGGVYLDRRFAIGLVANAITNDDTAVSGNDGVQNMGSYGGLLLQYVVQSNRLVHASVETTIGSGRWCNVINDANDGCSGKTFFAFEPAANVELNVFRHVRLTAGVGYRLAIAESGAGPSSRDLSSLVVRTGVIFGSF